MVIHSREKSCGALVFRRDGDRIYVLMIRHKAGGYRSFPKGHVEAGEDEHATAIREVAEETSVNIRIRSSFRETVYYSPAVGVLKEVVYFLAFTDQTEISPREGEIAEVEWIPIEKAEASLSHENDRVVFRSALKRIGNPLGE